MSMNLTYDLRNGWNHEAEKLTYDFYIDLMMALVLMKVDSMKLQNENI